MSISEFDILAFKIKDYPFGITCLIVKAISASPICSTFWQLMGINNPVNDVIGFSELFVSSNMTLHDLIGHMKRSGDMGELRNYLSTVIVSEIQRSNMYQIEKRLRELEKSVKH